MAILPRKELQLELYSCIEGGRSEEAVHRATELLNRNIASPSFLLWPRALALLALHRFKDALQDLHAIDLSKATVDLRSTYEAVFS